MVTNGGHGPPYLLRTNQDPPGHALLTSGSATFSICQSVIHPREIFKLAIDNITPQVEVKSRRVGGATFQVPMEIRQERKVSVGMKNMILFARKRPGKSMSEKLASEAIAAYNNEGGAYKKKEDTHRMAEANKAFAHFRF